MSENEEFIREFLEESAENLDQLDQDLVALEKQPRDKSRLESIFRAIHTIKGTSGFFGFSKLGALAHDGESLLGRIRDGELVLQQEIATVLLNLVDSIREMLANIHDTGSEGDGDYRELSARLIRLASTPAAPAGDESTGDESTGDESTGDELAPGDLLVESLSTKAPEEALPAVDWASDSMPSTDHLPTDVDQQPFQEETQAPAATAASAVPTARGRYESMWACSIS